jgi:hypothetical protein
MQLISFIRNRIGLLVGTAITCATIHGTAAHVSLAWDPNSESNVAGYRVYYGHSSRTYPFVVDAGTDNTGIINNLQEGVTYYFAVTAYNDSGLESDFSGEISYTVPLRSIFALGDGSFRVRFQGVPERTYRIEYTESLTAPDWRTLGIVTVGANSSFEIIDRPLAGSAARFYRSVYPAR